MPHFLCIFGLQTVAVIGGFFLCMIFFAKKGIRLSKKETSGLILAGAGLFAFLGGIYFFDTRDAVLKCDKETNGCVYLRSTAANKTLREAERYDLSGAKTPTVERRYHRRRSGYKDYYYTVVVPVADGAFEFPHEFTFHEDAEEQARRFAAFLTSNKRFFTYKSLRAEGTDPILFAIMALMFTDALFFAGVLLLLSKYRVMKGNNPR